MTFRTSKPANAAAGGGEGDRVMEEGAGKSRAASAAFVVPRRVGAKNMRVALIVAAAAK